MTRIESLRSGSGIRYGILLSALLLCSPVAQAEAVQLPGLRDALNMRAQIDQAVRTDLIAAGMTMGSPEQRRVEVVDADNTRWLRTIVAHHGWPSRSMVGTDGAMAAFLLVQHADADHGFQARCLHLIELLGEDEVGGEALALLTDRVALASGRRQVFGSQVQGDCRSGFKPFPIADPSHVDERRARVGLLPLAAYLVTVQSVFCPITVEP